MYSFGRQVSIKDRNNYIELMRKGDNQYRELLILDSLRYVEKEVIKFKNTGVSEDDLWQEGARICIETIDEFCKESRSGDVNFISMIIESRVARGLKKYVFSYLYGITIGVTKYDDFSRLIDWYVDKMENNTPVHLADACRIMKCGKEDIYYYLFLCELCRSYDSCLYEGITYSIDFDRIVSNGDVMSVVKSILSDKEFNILCLRLGLRDGHAYTQDVVAKKYGITKARIGQIEHNALRKLRSSRRVKEVLGLV